VTQPVDQLLPKNGIGFTGYKTDKTRYGTASTVNFIKRLGVEWLAKRPQGPRLQIGDISPLGGGPCPNGGKDAQGKPTFHKSHAGGRDFDVQLVRADGRELVRSVKIIDASFDVGPTQQLVTMIEELTDGNLKYIFTASPEKLTGKHVTMEKEHVFHLHVRLLE
jgi:hypothetical protein